MTENAAGVAGAQGTQSGPPPVKRLPDFNSYGPDASASAHGFEPDGAGYKAEAKAGGQLGTITNSGSLGEGSVRSVFGDANASASGGLTRNGVEGSAGASAGAGLYSMDGKTPSVGNDTASANIKGGGRALAADVKGKGTVKLTREEATLSGELGASAVLGEVHGTAEFVLNPARVINGTVVNGVNRYYEWRKYKEKMEPIKGGLLDHNITLDLEGGLQAGFKAGIKGHATTGGKDKDGKQQGPSVGFGVTPPLSPVTVGASVGFQ